MRTNYLYFSSRVYLKLSQCRDNLIHSCAPTLINSGANVTVVAKYLGHTKIEETLNTYTHLFSNALNEIVKVIDNLE